MHKTYAITLLVLFIALPVATFGLMAEISEKHVSSLNILTDDLIDLQNDIKIK